MKQVTERLPASSHTRREPAWLLRAGILACALIALALLVIARIAAPNPSSAAALVGRPAPTFTLAAAQGGVKLSTPVRFQGASARPTLLVFFNTLCVHCLGEITIARQAADRATSDSLNVIFIDTPGENAQITGAYMTRLHLNPPVLLDTGGAVARAYGVSYWPTFALVDEQGVIRGVWVGETSAPTLSASIRHALSG